MYIERQASARLQRLWGAFPVVVVCGARQVGKTTLLRHVFPDCDYVAFDPAVDVEHARRDPDLFLDNHPCPVILDEVQYAPEVVAAVKRRVDAQAGKEGLYLLTGSQQWQVLRTVSEGLAGRAAFLDLAGFSLAEQRGEPDAGNWLAHWLADPAGFSRAQHRRLRDERRPHEVLWRGFLPQAVLLDLDLLPDFWAGYQRTYVERDARVLADVDDWQQFGLFLRLCAALTAQEVNHSQLGRDIGVTPQTARRWRHVLTGTFQWFEVPAFGTNLVKRVSGKPKGYLSDPGFVCYCQHIATPDGIGGHPLYGALFETAVACEIRHQLGLLPGGAALYHWRSGGGAEVDLLLERNGVLYPIEVKGTTNPSRGDASGIHAFRRSYPELRIAEGLVVAPTAQVRRLSDEAVAVPWDLAE